jgi:prevent-host-death family protein
MTAVSVSDARANLSALIDRAADGETIEIMRRGKPIARIVAPARAVASRPVDAAVLSALTATMGRVPWRGVGAVLLGGLCRQFRLPGVAG